MNNIAKAILNGVEIDAGAFMPDWKISGNKKYL